jgi:hypothetical protein
MNYNQVVLSKSEFYGKLDEFLRFLYYFPNSTWSTGKIGDYYDRGTYIEVSNWIVSTGLKFPNAPFNSIGSNAFKLIKYCKVARWIEETAKLTFKLTQKGVERVLDRNLNFKRPIAEFETKLYGVKAIVNGRPTGPNLREYTHYHLHFEKDISELPKSQYKRYYYIEKHDNFTVVSEKMPLKRK